MIDRRLHVLRMVRQHGTVTAAAGALHLTPSAVSQQVRALARDLGVDLLQPAGRGVRLTPAAQILLDHADRLHAAWEEAQADLDAHRLGDRGPIRLCGFPSVLGALLPAVTERLAGGDLPLGIVAAQADPDESLDLLIAGEADLAIVEASGELPATTDERFEQEHLFDDPLQLIVPVGHRLADRDQVALLEAVDEDWVGGPPGGSYHQIELLACRRAGFAPRFVHRALDWSAYLAIVEAGLGVALLPQLAVPATGTVRALPLSDVPVPGRRVVTCVRRGSTDQPAIRRLRDALRDAARNLGVVPPGVDEIDGLLRQQLTYYGARAGEYDLDMWQRDAVDDDRQALFAAVDEWVAGLPVRGRVLELGCGTGAWTASLARRATEVVAVDGAPEMLEVARERTAGLTNVTFVEADVLGWRPPGAFDLVFASFLYSHVPRAREDRFWDVVAEAVAPGGTIALLDAPPPHDDHEDWVDPDRGVVRRTLRDGTPHLAVKVFRSPDQIAAAMRERGWTADVTVLHDHVLAALGRAPSAVSP